MKKIVLPVCLILSSIVFRNCFLGDPIGPIEEHFIYPLSIGNKWNYHRELSIFNIRPNHDGPQSYTTFTDTIHSTAEVNVVRKEKIPNGVETFVLHTKLFESFPSIPIESESYYEQRKEGLFLHAYHGTFFGVTPNRAAANLTDKETVYVFAGLEFPDIPSIIKYIETVIDGIAIVQDDLIFEDPPVKVLSGNLYVGKRWIMRQRGKPWRVEKRVVGNELVKVPAGEFLCFKIHVISDIGDTGEWLNKLEIYEYISNEGLIKRDILVKDIIMTSPYDPEPIGLFDSRDLSVLTNTMLH